MTGALAKYALLPLAKLLGIGGLVYLLFDEIVIYLGSLFLNTAAFFVSLAGNVFNWLIDRTVVDLTGTLHTLGMMNGIDTVWTAFRDISNIVIIGMFTFIAISIILGLKEYGQKKMIAHVLIIAVLINFSLLFTKMIIDASNFTALQFYNSASLPKTTASGTAGNPATSDTEAVEKSDGISGRFLRIMGVTGYWDTVAQLDKSRTQNGSWSTLGYAVTGTVLLLVVAGVFLYGSFLLASRAALLVFIMIISPLAFASYLVPSLGSYSYSWKGWWQNLLRCAFFGPLLMIFLWASIIILSKAPTGNVSFGKFLSDPANSNAWQLVVMYCFTVAFLILSIRFASSFAGKIEGFSLASALTAAPFTNAFRAAGLGLRLGVGLPSYFASKRYAKDAAGDRDKMAKAEIQAKRFDRLKDFKSADREWARAKSLKDAAAGKMKTAGLYSKFADSRYNLMDTGIAKTALGAIGVKGFAAGGSSKLGIEQSISDRIETRAKAAEKMAAKLAPSKDQNDEARREARRVVREQRQLGLAQLEATRNAQGASAKAMKDVEKLPAKLATAQQNALSEKTDAEAKMTVSAQKLQTGTISQAQHTADMNKEKQRIERANKAVQAVQQRINTLDEPVRDAERAIKAYDDRTEALAKAAGKEIVDAMRDSAIDIAEKIGAKQGDIITRNTIGRLGENKAVADATKDLYKTKIRTARFRDAIKLTREEEGGGSSPAAPTDDK